MRSFSLTKVLSLLLLFTGLVGQVSTPVSAQGEAAAGLTMKVVAGFDGFYKAANGVPVQVTVANNGPAIQGKLQIIINPASSNDRVIYEAPVDLPTQSNKKLALYVHINSFVSSLEVSLLDDDQHQLITAASNDLNQLQTDDLLYGVISPDPGEFSFLENVDAGRGRAAVAYLEIDQLPEVPAAWNALDVLVFNDMDSGQLAAEQKTALTGWTSTGGQLVVTGGPGWQKTTASLTNLLPVTVTGSQPVEDLPALSQRADIRFRDPGPYLLTTSTLSKGELIIHQDGLPLLAYRHWGRGAIYFLALDPRMAPLLDWDGSELIWAEVAGRVPLLPGWGRNVQNSYAAATAVSSLPSLALPSVLQLILFLFIYVLMIGPINYLVLRRINRRELAWATVPTLVILFSGMAYLTGFQLKGNDTILNEMSYTYGQAGGEQMRVQTLLGLYSPRRATYDLHLPGSALARPFKREFGGLSGGGNLEAISRGSDLTLRGIRVDVSDTQTFVAESYQPALPISGQAVLNLDGSEIRLDVSIQNDSQLTLENASLLLGTDVISLGDLNPGQSRQQTRVMGTAFTGKPSPSGAPPGIVPGPVSGSPLMNHADVILGTTNYYNDRDAFPRWQMLQAFETEYATTRVGGGSALSSPSNVATLIAWSQQPQLEMSLPETEYTTLHTTLHFVELPITQNLVSGNNVSIPQPLLNWRVLAESGTYQATIHNLYLNAAWVEFEFQAWPQFQSMQVRQLAIALQPENAASGASPPEVRLWNWQQEVWDIRPDIGWGISPVNDSESYLGPGNAVRIRLQDVGGYGSQIGEVYPVLTGDLN